MIFDLNFPIKTKRVIVTLLGSGMSF